MATRPAAAAMQPEDLEGQVTGVDADVLVAAADRTKLLTDVPRTPAPVAAVLSLRGPRSPTAVTTRRLRGLAVVTFAATVLLYLVADALQIVMAGQSGDSVLYSNGEIGAVPFSLVILAFPLVGLLLTRRQPTNAIGWLMLGIGLCWAVRAFWFDGYLRWTLVAYPSSLPAAEAVGALSFPLWIPCIGIMGTFLILLYPDGRLPSRRWRPVAWASGSSMVGLYLLSVIRPGPVAQAPVPDLVNPFAVDALLPAVPVLDGLTLTLPLCIVACAAGLLVRLRRSRGIERLQLKWLATAGAFIASGYLVLMLVGAYVSFVSAVDLPGWFAYLTDAFFVSFVLVPVAVGVAVLKHGLYGIDRLISRSVNYLIVSGTLLGVYVAVVTGLSRLTPSGSSLAVAVSTLAVAALFHPLRRRVQASVDRRFNRAHYDAERIVETFTARRRDDVDLDAVRADLLSAVRETMQPSTMSLWVRTSE